ncbi:sigma-70 family RNA polymerase sigma factor [Adhaeretor mobilis]|uniref:ECF RNA polymerase sigma factor SigW n=1 Tax=Adhaeretor mobilis TaxID=1930276 RepID=A0A517MUI4_9BACT|nr:sigma-70 family RNA polymerase sigma factor [Adhaeretor mobilis]QDS98447.1 ECF RNA polymerase sigma factor SigW [Adhaeretor mobilis]
MPPSDTTAVTDALLLARFVQTCDEQAFRELVERHSRLVFGVCTRVLGHRQDAEEAFQATFLVLTQKADQLEVAGTIGPWLYGVAYRVAVRAAQRRTRRRESSLPGDVMARSLTVGDDMLDHLADKHWRAVLDEELNRLPKKYREPLVLQYLLGKKNPEIAFELGLTIRTVEGRQRRGKERLRRRLALRKVSLPLAVATKSAASKVIEAAPLKALIDTTVQASISLASGKEAAALSQGTLSQKALTLSRPEVIAMNLSLAPAAVLATVILVAGAAYGITKNEAGTGKQHADALPLTEEVSNDQSPKSKTLRDFAVQLAVASPSETTIFTAHKGQASAASSDYLPKTKSPYEARIYQALTREQHSPLEYRDAPLDQVIQAIGEEYDIQIVFDMQALEALAINPETEITIRLSSLPLKSALKLLLREVEDLTYIVRDDVLVITSKDEANAHLETRIYNTGEFKIDVEALSTTLQETVRSDAWQKNGTGEGVISQLNSNLLAISQTQAVHEEIAAFLTELQQHVKEESGAGSF